MQFSTCIKASIIAAFTCLSAQAVAQASIWSYTAGQEGYDAATGIVQTDDGGYVISAIGGVTADITFSVLHLDLYGNLVWFTEVDKNAATEIPMQVIRNQFNTGYILTGSANATENLWVTEVDNDGNIVASSESWSDASGPLTGRSARIASINDTNYAIIAYFNDSIETYITNATIEQLHTVKKIQFPGDSIRSELAITDIVSLASETAFVLTGNTFSTTTKPYLYIISSAGDSVIYIPFTIDDVYVQAIDTTSSGGVIAIGTTIDSTAFFFSSFSSLSGSITEFDTVYASPGYKVVGKDITELSDGTFWLLINNYHPLETFSSYIRIDAVGNILDEVLLLEGAGEIALQNITKTTDGIFPLAAVGFINTNNPEKENEILVIRSDSVNFPLCIYDCVWPGDADNNGQVTMEDLLYIGAAYSTLGIARPAGVSVDFLGQISEPWVENFPTGMNYKYVDVNGDGIIESSDTAGIVSNYNLFHNIFTLRESGGEAYPLWLNTAGYTIHEGLNEIPIMLGTETVPVAEIYGLVFNINYNGPPIIDSTTVTIHFYDSWLGNEALHFLQLDKNFPEQHSIDAGVTRKDKNNTSGYGEIGKMSFVVEDNIAGISWTDSIVIFTILNASGITAGLDPVTISTSAYAVAVVGINDTYPMHSIGVYPNPVTQNVMHVFAVSNDLINAQWNIYSLLGSSLYTGTMNNNSIAIPDNLQSGEYMLEIVNDLEIYHAPFMILKD
jgi:hypothetical protein